MLGIPKLAAYWDESSKDWVVDCRYCARLHRHGGLTADHRQAHCLNDASPYHRTGYELVPSGQLPPRLLERRVRR